jgi:hypothetical protein
MLRHFMLHNCYTFLGTFAYKNRVYYKISLCNETYHSCYINSILLQARAFVTVSHLLPGLTFAAKAYMVNVTKKD